jgi:hypothetical protein
MVFGVLADSDVYMLTARSDYYWGISGGVAPMEAMALNAPYFSNTSAHT